MKYVLIHGLGLSSTVWGPLAALMQDDAIVCVDLPGHGGCADGRYEWAGIWDYIAAHIEPGQWHDTTVVLHSFSAALLPELVASGVRPARVIPVEGILHPDDAVWTSELNLLDDTLFAAWLPRFRAVAAMTLKSQLVSKQRPQDVQAWSDGFRSVDGDALRTMASKLVQRVNTTEIANALEKAAFPVIYIRGQRSRLSGIGLAFIDRHAAARFDVAGSGHFPMIDNPAGLQQIFNRIQ